MAAEECRVDRLGRERRCQRQVAARDALREAQEVRRTTSSCSQANIVPVRPNPVATSSTMRWTSYARHSSAARCEEAGGMDQHSGGALDQRLHDERRNLVCAVRELAPRGPRATWRRVPGGRESRCCERAADRTHGERDRCHRRRPRRACRRDTRRPAEGTAASRSTDELPVLERLLQRDLDRCRSRVRVEDARQSRGATATGLGTESDARLVRQAQEGRVRDAARADRAARDRDADGDGHGRCTTTS